MFLFKKSLVGLNPSLEDWNWEYKVKTKKVIDVKIKEFLWWDPESKIIIEKYF